MEQTRSAMDQLSTLAAERAALVEKLLHVSDRPVQQLDPDLWKGYGRIRQIDREIPGERFYAEQANWLGEHAPKSLEELDAVVSHAERLAPSFALAWQVRNSATDEQRERYELGQTAAFEDWHAGQLPRLEVVEKLTAYANEQNGLSYVNAEAEMARSFAAQLSAGKSSIDLSGHYLTHDPEAAAGRHAKALGNLESIIRDARNAGFTVNEGEAKLAAHKLAEAEPFRYAERP